MCAMPFALSFVVRFASLVIDFPRSRFQKCTYFYSTSISPTTIIFRHGTITLSYLFSFCSGIERACASPIHPTLVLCFFCICFDSLCQVKFISTNALSLYPLVLLQTKSLVDIYPTTYITPAVLPVFVLAGTFSYRRVVSSPLYRK
jgi:hypothetical protein